MAQNSTPEALGSSVRRSNDGTFACGCGKRYREVQSLNRHRTRCMRWNLMEQSENAREESPEGNTLSP